MPRIIAKIIRSKAGVVIIKLIFIPPLLDWIWRCPYKYHETNNIINKPIWGQCKILILARQAWLPKWRSESLVCRETVGWAAHIKFKWDFCGQDCPEDPRILTSTDAVSCNQLLLCSSLTVALFLAVVFIPLKCLQATTKQRSPGFLTFVTMLLTMVSIAVSFVFACS